MGSDTLLLTLSPDISRRGGYRTLTVVLDIYHSNVADLTFASQNFWTTVPTAVPKSRKVTTGIEESSLLLLEP